MTRQETGIIMDILRAAYPRFYAGPEAPDPKAAISLWAGMFADEPVELVAAAVKAFIASDTKGFPPHIGAIKNAIHDLRSAKSMDETEAWNLVRKAVANSGYEAAEEFRRLPEQIQRIVGSSNQLRDWSQMDSDTLNSVVASNFQRAYRTRQESYRRDALMPPDVKKAISGIVGDMFMLEAGDDF